MNASDPLSQELTRTYPDIRIDERADGEVALIDDSCEFYEWFREPKLIEALKKMPDWSARLDQHGRDDAGVMDAAADWYRELSAS